MKNFKTYCERKFPNNWEIVDKGHGLFHFRDNLVPKGRGFTVIVQEEVNKYEVSLIFENFAKGLSNHSENILSNSNGPLIKLIELYPNLTVLIHKHYIETNLDPATNKFENFDFQLFYKRQNRIDDDDIFSDILISFILFIFPYKVEADEEGEAQSLLLTKYERSNLNRSLCLAYHGYSCKACEVNLKNKYGDIARDFIHVHHLNPISKSGIIIPDPIIDFIPLCPNCHAIAHLKNPPLTVEEIKKMIQDNGNQNY
jgi:hypothetical protein